MIYRKFVSVLMFSLIGLYAIAQDDNSKMETLFGDGPTTYGGYGGPRVAYTQFDGQDAWLVGGRGGVVINHSFVIGGAGYGIVNSPSFLNIEYEGTTYPKAYLEGGYGGMYLEYILMPNKIVHLSFPVLVGAGGLLYAETSAASAGGNFEETIITNTSFFVVEPGVEVELNVVRFMRVSAGISYRYTKGVELPNTPTNAFNSLSGSISLKFGKF